MHWPSDLLPAQRPWALLVAPSEDTHMSPAGGTWLASAAAEPSAPAVLSLCPASSCLPFYPLKFHLVLSSSCPTQHGSRLGTLACFLILPCGLMWPHRTPV